MWDNFAGRSIGKLADLDVFFREKIPGEQLTTVRLSYAVDSEENFIALFD